MMLRRLQTFANPSFQKMTGTGRRGYHTVTKKNGQFHLTESQPSQSNALGLTHKASLKHVVRLQPNQQFSTHDFEQIATLVSQKRFKKYPTYSNVNTVVFMGNHTQTHQQPGSTSFSDIQVFNTKRSQNTFTSTALNHNNAHFVGVGNLSNHFSKSN